MLRRIAGNVIRNHNLIAHILCMLQNRCKAEISIMDLIVNGNHNRYFRAVCLREYEFSILQVLFSDLKIALDSIFSLPGCIHSNVLYRVKKSILAVTQNLPLSGPLRIHFIKCLPDFPSHLKNNRFVAV